ncbi:MAG: hypothetical protein ER33_09860 [Cyanobium sp. CACIAM 14]|nr:MAG: hypothetical protein ER33_09860 [Cyanobium sp. CACIAM 14]
MKLLGEFGQVVTIERSDFGKPGTPAGEDLLLNITIVVGGYSAADQAWVVANDWRGFMHQLRALEHVRQGQAELVGASPQNLKLTFWATDHAGHMAVSGFLGWRSPDGFNQKCEFGFAFDAGMLSIVVQELEALGYPTT